MPKVNSKRGARRQHRHQSPCNDSNEIQLQLKAAQSEVRKRKTVSRKLEDALSKLQKVHAINEGNLLAERDLLHEAFSELTACRALDQSYKKIVAELESLLKKKEQENEVLKSDLLAAEDKFKREAALRAENERQLYRAQRHIRSFDPMSSFQQEIRSGSDYESIRRCPNYSPSSDYSKIIELVQGLNGAIHKFANSFVHNAKFLKHSENRPVAATAGVEALLGKPMLTVLRSKAFNWQSCDLKIPFIAIRMFLCAWCLSIIEGWYPKRQSFLDLLIKLNKSEENSKKASYLAQTEIITNSADVDYHAWTDDVLLDLSPELQIGGIKVNHEDISEQLVPILKEAYNIRTALAEKDLYGNIELSPVTLCTPFKPGAMQARYRVYDFPAGTPSAKPSKSDYVIGNTSLGLEVNVSGGGNGGSSSTRVVLIPLVVVSTTIDFGPNNLLYSCISL